MPTTLTNGIQLPDKGSVDWYNSMQSNYNLIDTHLGNTDVHVTAEDKANWDSKQGSLSQAQLDAIAQVATNTSDIATLQSGKANASHTHSSSDITDIGDYATKQYVDNSISGLVDNAPAALDTLKELSTALNDDANFASTVTTALGAKANSADLATVATSGDYDDLTDLPTYGITRLCSSAITDNSTVAFSAISSTDKIKAGDFLLDTNGKLYQISSVDTVNETAAVTTPLTQLAIDSNVVHTSGNETVGGSKTFTWPITITSYPCIRMYLSDDEWNVQPASAKQSEIRFTDKNAVLISYITFQHRTDANEPFRTCWRQQKMDGTSGYFSVNFNNLGEFYPENYNSIKLGKPNNRWLGVYAMNYYYGANDVEFSTKFVTSDTTQTITGAKTFSSTPVIYNSDISDSTANLYLRNQLVTKGDTSSSGNQHIRFADTNNKMLGRIQSAKVTNGNTTLNLRADTIDANNTDVTVEVQVIAQIDGNKSFSPQADNAVDLGRTLAKWRNLLVNQINGLNPSSLSLPSTRDSAIDISSYFTNFNNGDTNQYTPTVNGWIYLETTGCNALHCFCTTTGNLVHYGNTVARANDGMAYVTFPVLENTLFRCTWYTNSTITLSRAWFIPCQGNV